MAMFTEEVGVLAAAARNPKAGIRRSELVRDGRLINKAVLKVDNDLLVTNAAVDTLVAQGLLEDDDRGFMLTLAGARALLNLHRQVWMLSKLLKSVGAGNEDLDEATPIDLTDEVLPEEDEPLFTSAVSPA